MKSNKKIEFGEDQVLNAIMFCVKEASENDREITKQLLSSVTILMASFGAALVIQQGHISACEIGLIACFLIFVFFSIIFGVIQFFLNRQWLVKQSRRIADHELITEESGPAWPTIVQLIFFILGFAFLVWLVILRAL